MMNNISAISTNINLLLLLFRLFILWCCQYLRLYSITSSSCKRLATVWNFCSLFITTLT